MDKRAKSNATWGIVAILHEPVTVYVAILGVYTLQLPRLAFVPEWQNILVGVLLLVSGTLYIRNCVRTLRTSTSGPQNDPTNVAIAASFLWRGVVLLLFMAGLFRLPEAHPTLFWVFASVAGAALITLVTTLFVQTCVRSYQAFLQGMQEAKQNP